MQDKNYFGSSTRSNQARINITSLMDVLTIILIFLLTNYSDEPPEQDPPKGVTIPIVIAKSKKNISKNFTKEIRVVFASDRIEIGDQVIPFESFDEQSSQILSLASDKLKEAIDVLKPEEKKDSAIILIADKDVDYSMISNLIQAASIAGVTNVEFLGTLEEKE